MFKRIRNKFYLILILNLLNVFASLALARSQARVVGEMAVEGVDNVQQVYDSIGAFKTLESWWDSWFIKDVNDEECIKNYLGVGEAVENNMYLGAAGYVASKLALALKPAASPQVKMIWISLHLLILAVDVFDIGYSTDTIGNLAVAELNHYRSEGRRLATDLAEDFNGSIFIDEGPFSTDRIKTTLNGLLSTEQRHKIRSRLRNRPITAGEMEYGIAALYKNHELCDRHNRALPYPQLALRLATVISH